MPVAVDGRVATTLVPPYRGRSSSSCSSGNCHNISSSDGNVSIASINSGNSLTPNRSNNNSISGSNSNSVNTNSNASTNSKYINGGSPNNSKNRSNISISNNSSSNNRVSTVVTVPAPAAYGNPGDNSNINVNSNNINNNNNIINSGSSSSYQYIYSSKDLESCGSVTDLSNTPKYSPALYGCANQQGDYGQVGQYYTPVDPAESYCVMSAGPTPSQGSMYWMPVVAVPYASSMGQVNLGWSPSQDPYGKDLPLSGVEYYRMSSCAQSTSYPSGVMYAPHSGSEMLPPGAVVVDSCGNYSSVSAVVCTGTASNKDVSVGTGRVNASVCASESAKMASKMSTSCSISQSVGSSDKHGLPTSSGGNSSGRDRDSAMSGYPYESDKNVSGKITAGKPSESSQPHGASKDGKALHDGRANKCQDGVKDNEGGEGKGVSPHDDEDSVSEGMDVGSDGDSGCPSECTDLSPVGGHDSVFTSSELEGENSSSTTDQTNSSDGSKPRGKRRYYMYGNHKLIKPIKEIPLRFQILLAETSAAKARCEGQPIYMQHQPPPQQGSYDVVYYPAYEASQPPQLNANATCFVPSQDGGGVEANVATAYMPECYTVCPVSGFSNTAPSASNPSGFVDSANPLQPAPLFVPQVPPTGGGPPTSSSSQTCQTIIVYSSHSAHPAGTQSPSALNHQVRTMNMPPPPFPPPTLPLPSVEHMSTNSTPCISPAVSKIPVSAAANHIQSKTLSFPDHPVPSAVSNKPPVVLSVPPPNHAPSVQVLPPHVNSSISHVNPSPLQQATNPCMLSNHSFKPIPQHLAPPSSLPAPQVGGASMQAPPSSNGTSPPANYPGGMSYQYMYVYPSPPAGQSATPPHVVYMVSPAYQQQGVAVPPTCPVPVQ